MLRTPSKAAQSFPNFLTVLRRDGSIDELLFEVKNVSIDLLSKSVVLRPLSFEEGFVPVIDQDLERWSHPTRLVGTHTHCSFGKADVI